MNTQATNPQVKTIEVGETRLAYIEQGSGEALVFVHGAVSDFRSWTEQLDAFSARYRAISYSRRAHYPNAPTGASPYTRAQHAADLIGFLRALKLEKAHLVGHSYGAAVALLAALGESALVGSLILAEPSPFPELFSEPADAALLAEQKAGFDKARRLAENGERAASVREFLHTVIGIDAFFLLPEERRAVVLENAATLSPMLKNYYEPSLKREQLKKLKVPTLFITGEISPLIARLSCKALDRHLPNSRIAVLKSASHGLQMENPHGFHALVGDFLDAQRKAPPDEKSQLYSPIFNQKLD